VVVERRLHAEHAGPGNEPVPQRTQARSNDRCCTRCTQWLATAGHLRHPLAQVPARRAGARERTRIDHRRKERRAHARHAGPRTNQLGQKRKQGAVIDAVAAHNRQPLVVIPPSVRASTLQGEQGQGRRRTGFTAVGRRGRHMQEHAGPKENQIRPSDAARNHGRMLSLHTTASHLSVIRLHRHLQGEQGQGRRSGFATVGMRGSQMQDMQDPA